MNQARNVSTFHRDGWALVPNEIESPTKTIGSKFSEGMAETRQGGHLGLGGSGEPVRKVVVGQIVAEKEASRANVLGVLKWAWSEQKEIEEVNEIGNSRFMFEFQNSRSTEMVVKGSPWTINGDSM